MGISYPMSRHTGIVIMGFQTSFKALSLPQGMNRSWVVTPTLFSLHIAVDWLKDLYG